MSQVLSDLLDGRFTKSLSNRREARVPRERLRGERRIRPAQTLCGAWSSAANASRTSPVDYHGNTGSKLFWGGGMADSVRESEGVDAPQNAASAEPSDSGAPEETVDDAAPEDIADHAAPEDTMTDGSLDESEDRPP